MRKMHFIIFLVAVFTFITAQAQAGEWTYGFKLAYFELDESAVDDPDNAGLMLGYSWPNEYGSFGVEGEFTSTFEDGSSGVQDVQMDTAGIYGVYRTKGISSKGMGPYFKLKAGAAYSDLTIGNVSEDDSNFSVGLGLGLNMHVVAFELEYTNIGDDLDMLNLLVRF